MSLGALREIVAARDGQSLGKFDAVVGYMGEIIGPLLVDTPTIEVFATTPEADTTESEPWLGHCLSYAHNLFGREITASTARYFPGFLFTQLIPQRQQLTDAASPIIKRYIPELELYLQGLGDDEIRTRLKRRASLEIAANRIKVLDSLHLTYSFGQLRNAFRGYVDFIQQTEE